MKWTDKEEGPACFCGMPTVVTVAENGAASLVCLYHEADRGALFPLPRDKRPDNWPRLTEDEVDMVMFEGQDEADSKLVQEAKGDEKNKFGLS
jgi:hypothetical protein